MHALYMREEPVPTLYVKSLAGCKFISLCQMNAPRLFLNLHIGHGPEYAIRQIFVKARQSTPCLLVFEDLDSLITDRVKSFLLNEVDGLESNEGLMMLGSTNYLERLDAGISKRPGRFDDFALPATAERIKYCDYWRTKLTKNNKIDYPPKLSEAIAEVTEGFSFAYLKETFITSLLIIVGSRKTSRDIDGLAGNSEEVGAFDNLLLWRVLRSK